jgi:hypothetical protein
VADGACHCDRCAGLSASDQALLYANRLLRAIREEQPQATVSCLAYLSTIAPPGKVRPDPGVFLEFAPIRRCYRHALADAECAVNAEQVAALRKLLEFWGETPWHVTEYWLDASLFSGWKRPAQRIPTTPEVMRDDIVFYASLGARSVTSYAVMCDREYWQRFGPPPLAEYGAALAAAR